MARRLFLLRATTGPERRRERPWGRDRAGKETGGSHRQKEARERQDKLEIYSVYTKKSLILAQDER